MLGRLAKLWYVNIRYAGNTITHRDTKLNFCIMDYITKRRTEPGNVLIPLENGDGKGLLLQLITNLFDPMVDWKDGKNKIEHLFYNSKEKPIQYTGYVVAELDIGNDRRLMLGLGITPRIISREQQREEKSDITVDYIQFVREYSIQDDFDIFELPLYNKEEKDGISFSNFKKFVDENYKDQIEIINVNNRSAYTQLLHSYGYTKSAISNMKQLNQQEGSVEAYFSNAMTNDGLFYNKIIPSIYDELQNTDSTKDTSDLVLAFLDTVKIAKKLPEMMKTIESAAALKEWLLPVKVKLLKGMEQEELQKNLKHKGYAIKDMLNDVYLENNREIHSVQNEITTKNDTLNQINYEIDNVDYSKTYGVKVGIEKQLSQVEQEIQQQKTSLNALNKDLSKEQINKRLKIFDHHQNEIELKSQIKLELEQSLEHQELVSKLRDIREKIQKRWSKQIQPHWEQLLNKSELYQIKCEEKINEQKKEKDELIEKRGEINKFKKDLNEAIHTHKVKLDTVITRKHGEKAKFNLEGAINDNEIRINLMEESRLRDQSELKNAQNHYNELSSKMNLLKYKKNQTEQELSSLKEELKKVLNVEEELSEHINDYLKIEDSAQPTREWFQTKLTKVLSKMDAYNDRVTLNKRGLWAMESNLQLLKEGENFDVWIPNQDVLYLKQKLDEQSIPCMFGSELLAPLSRKAREKELEQNPLIPYSVIVSQSDLSNIDDSLLKGQLNGSLATLLVRQDMKNEQAEKSFSGGFYKLTSSGYVVKGKGYELLKNKDDWEFWKLEVVETAIKLEEDNNTLTQLIDQGKGIVEQINSHLSKKISIELSEEESQLQHLYQSLTDESEKTEEESNSLQNEIDSLNKTIEEKAIELQKERDDLRDLLSWQEECLINERNHSHLIELDKDYRLLSDMLESLQNTITSKSNYLKTFQNELARWSHSASRWLEEIQATVAGAVYPRINIDPNADLIDVEKPSLNEVLDHQSQLLLETYQELNAEKGSSNFKIERLNNEISNAIVFKNQEIEWLNLNGGDWEETPIPEETVAEIEEFVRQMEHKIKSLESDIHKQEIDLAGVKSDLRNIEQRLKMQRNAILEKHHNREPFYISGLHYDTEKANLIHQRKETAGALDSLNNQIKTIKESQNEIDVLMETALAHIAYGTVSFTLSDEEKLLAKTNPRKLASIWVSEKEAIDTSLEKHRNNIQKDCNGIHTEMELNKSIYNKYKDTFKEFIFTIQSSQFSEATQLVDRILFWSEKEVAKETDTRGQAEQAVRFFTNRCTEIVEDVITGVKISVNKTKVKNMEGDFIEFIRFEKNYKFPSNKDEIKMKIKEHCLQTIERIVENVPDADDIKIKDVIPYMNISQLMKVVLERFPKLYLYIPDGSGFILTEKPKEHLYKEWQVINNGGGKGSSKSGGQTIMAQMMMISMLQKKVNDDGWTMIITDNLFGAMSAKKLVQPLFVLLKLLKIQWVTVVGDNAPVQVTSNFDVVYLLSVNYNNKGQGIVTYEMEQHERRFLNRISVIDDLKKENNQLNKPV